MEQKEKDQYEYRIQKLEERVANLEDWCLHHGLLFARLGKVLQGEADNHHALYNVQLVNRPSEELPKLRHL